MGTIAKVTAGGTTHLVASTCYGICTTDANTIAKVATIQDSQAFTLMTGVTVHIKFTNSNTAADPTLNVNSTGAKAIKAYGTTKTGASATTSWYAGSVVSFTYDGTNWIQNDYKNDTDTTYSLEADTTNNKITLKANGTTQNSITVPYASNAGAMKEAFLSWGGKNFTGDYGCIDAAMVNELGADRLMFLKPAGITIEYTRDGGTTWEDYGATNEQKVNLFSTTNSSFSIGKSDSTHKATEHGTDYQLRVTIDTELGRVYTSLNKFIFYVSTNGSSSSTVTIQKALQSTPTEYTDVATNVAIVGWSGYNVVNTSSITTYGNSASSQYGRIRFIFKANGGNTNYNGLSVSKILAFGGVGWTTPSTMAKTGHIYSFDANQNATFPANIKMKNGKQVGFLTSTPTTGQVVVTDGTDGGLKTTGYTIETSVPPNAKFTDRYVNSAAFDYDSTNDNVKMTLTRAGSDTGTVVKNIPKVSSATAGVAPKGAAVSAQSQSTKFLREDGTWAAPSYTTNTNTTYTISKDGESVKLTGSNGGTSSVSLSSLINGLGEGSSNATANDYIVTQYAGGGTSNTTYYRRKASNVINSTLVKAALGTGSDTTKYLNNKGEWAVPPNTTYSFAEGTANGKFQVTPSGGTAQSVAVHGLNNLAYKSSASATYTPAGNCTGGNVTLNTTTVPNVTGVGSLPTCTFPELSLSVNSNKRLIISHTEGSFNQGSLPTLGTAITVATSVKSVTQPTFGGTQATITVS
jgi:hypothetical protein